MTALDDITRSLTEHRLNRFYYERFQRDNPNLAPAVIAYLDGGARPSDAFLGANHYALGLVLAEDARRKLAPTPPVGGKLRWAPPALSNPVVRAAGPVPKGSGQDLRLTPAQLSSNIGQIEGYRNVESIAGAINGGSSNSSGHIVPRENTGIFHWEGWKIKLTNPGDAFAARWRTPTIQIEACDIEVTDALTSFHSDGFQTQEAIVDELRLDRVTIATDYQGLFFSNEAQNQGPGRSKLSKQIISRVLFKTGRNGLPATFFFKAFPPRPNADPIGTTEMFDVWQPAQDALAHTYPNGHTWMAWDGTANRYGCFLEQKLHANGRTYPFLRFSTAGDKVPAGKLLAGQTCGDCGVRGDGGIWLYSALIDVPAEVGAPENAGLGYVSPGYL